MDTGTRTDANNLFHKSLTVNVYEGGSSYSRKHGLLVSVEWSSSTSANFRRELVIRITDENDPFFIYNLNLCEDDFQSLKTQQGLLVDFLSFPQKFIDLLQLCSQEELKDHPKFLLNVSTNGRLGTDGGAATLDVVETNPFKLLTHLSLKLLPASDDFIKKYLASNIKSLKVENCRLDSCLRGTQSDLQGRLQSCQQELATRSREWEQRQRQLQGEICSLSQRHQDQLKEEQERIMGIHREAETRWTQEKQELELKISREANHTGTRTSLLESSNKELQERLQRSDSNLRDVQNHLVQVQGDLQQSQAKVNSLSREAQALSIQLQEHLKASGNLRGQLSQLQQEVEDKDNVSARTKDLLETTQQQKIHFERLCEQRQEIITKKESAIKTVSEELNKGNDIIRKLQTEIKNYHSKLKLRNQVTTRQEEILNEREEKLRQAQNEILQQETKLKAFQEESTKLNSEVVEAKKKLEECQKQIKSNENIITWLNKQLNDVHVVGNRPLYDGAPSRLHQQPFGMTTSTPLSRPTFSPTISPSAHPLYRPPVFNSAYNQPNGAPRFPYIAPGVQNSSAYRSPLTTLQNRPEVPSLSNPEVIQVLSRPATADNNSNMIPKEVEPAIINNPPQSKGPQKLKPGLKNANAKTLKPLPPKKSIS